METLKFSVSPLLKKEGAYKGNVYATQFEFKQQNFFEYTETAWEFGDGNTAYNSTTAAHIYNYPGIYQVSLSAWSNNGYLQTAKEQIDVDYIIRDSMVATKIPADKSVVGAKTKECFTIALTSTRIQEPIVVALHSLGSASIPYSAAPQKWNFLTQRWRFVDATTNEVISGNLIEVNTAPIYSNSNQIAVSGEFSFYYIDDSPTRFDSGVGCPAMLIVTLSAQNFLYPPETLRYPYYSYSNTESVQVAIPRFIMDLVPTELKITENYLSNVYPIKWTTVPVPVMVTCMFNPLTLPSFASSTDVLSSSDMFSYPKTNIHGNVNPVTLSLSGVDPSLYVVDEAPNIFFNATDDDGGLIRGYIFTTITPLSPISATCVVASTTAVNLLPDTANPKRFQFPVGYNIPTEVYVSHPFECNLNKINIVPYSSNCQTVDYFRVKKALRTGVIQTIAIPQLSSNTVDNLQLSGTAGVYGMSYNPNTETLYAADSDQNTILKIDKNGKIITSVQVSATTLDSYNTPSCVSVAENGDVWVSLYDSHQLLKYTADLSAVACVAMPFNSTQLLTAVDEFDSPLIAPPIVETTNNGEVWACYANPLSSLLVKYNSSGNLLLSCTELESTSEPSCLAIDKDYNVWVACKNTNQVQQYDSNGNKKQSFSFLRPSFISIDNDNDVWVAHGYNLLSYVNTATLQVNTWRVTFFPKLEITLAFTRPYVYDEYPEEDLRNILSNDEIWGGLTVDVFNRVWVIDSVNNNIGMFNKSTITNFKVMKAYPTASTNYIVETGLDYVTHVNVSSELPQVPVRSIQASGDWSGNRWLQKYANKYITTSIKGASTPFEVLPLVNNEQILTMDIYVRDSKRASVNFTGDRVGSMFGYRVFDVNIGDAEAYDVFQIGRVDLNIKEHTSQLDQFEYVITGKSKSTDENVSLSTVTYDEFLFTNRRKQQFKLTKTNGNFDFAEYFNRLALPQTLIESPLLISEFITGLFGNGEGMTEDASRTIYEKTANFVANHSDIETAEIDKLISLAEALSIDSKTFGSNFPTEVIKYLNVFSTPIHNLRGVPVYQTIVAENLGAYLNITDTISAGEYILAKDKAYDEYKLIFVNALTDGTLIYPLSSLNADSLRKYPSEQYYTQYHFFKYNTENIIGFQNNTIEWDANLTAISRTLSGYEDWYKEDGVAEIYFNNTLTRGLFS